MTTYRRRLLDALLHRGPAYDMYAVPEATSDATDHLRITTVPDRPGEATIHLPEFTYLDTQVWSVEIGVPVELLPALRDAIDAHLLVFEEPHTEAGETRT